MGWSWYLANDMQFYVISPLFLITLWRWPKFGYSVIGLFFCITFTTNFAITYEYNVVAGLGKVIEQAHNFGDFIFRATDFFDLIYHKPYNRIGPYLIGVLLAYYFYKRKQNNAPKLKLVSLTTGWIIAACVALTCQFSLFHENFSRVETSFYNALSRSGFACGVAWVIFVCVTGQGGVVNRVLSWKVWIPFSRLTYCAYLVHPIIHNAFFVSVKRLMEFSHTNMVSMVLYILNILFI
ncbi:Nose resistant to fluoxetine protein 6 [Araneus ventricosus]|uniref:Nose resistant to fluoxetine protein 6 n=1 Tax=Araneus ventricosus TaxID=182803 RepID=A0A4Y2IV86_ARAVE|nr:Nose resistant to fluoxetine protein 6 [Araneus ventricosus]